MSQPLDRERRRDDNQNPIIEQRFVDRNRLSTIRPRREDIVSRHLTLIATAVLAALPLSALPLGAQAQDVYKIGASVGLTGYAAANDRFWRDGLNVAAEVLNAKGG